MSYGQLLLTVAPVIALIALGLPLRRSGWISEAGEETLLTLIVRVLMPALIFESVVGRAVVSGSRSECERAAQQKHSQPRWRRCHPAERLGKKRCEPSRPVSYPAALRP